MGVMSDVVVLGGGDKVLSSESCFHSSFSRNVSFWRWIRSRCSWSKQSRVVAGCDSPNFSVHRNKKSVAKSTSESSIMTSQSTVFGSVANFFTRSFRSFSIGSNLNGADNTSIYRSGARGGSFHLDPVGPGFTVPVREHPNMPRLDSAINLRVCTSYEFKPENPDKSLGSGEEEDFPWATP